jgi:hypothetical protein
MLSPLQTIAGAALLGAVAFAFPEDDAVRLPDAEVRTVCAELRAPESYLPPEPSTSTCPGWSEKKLAAR